MYLVAVVLEISFAQDADTKCDEYCPYNYQPYVCALVNGENQKFSNKCFFKQAQCLAKKSMFSIHYVIK